MVLKSSLNEPLPACSVRHSTTNNHSKMLTILVLITVLQSSIHALEPIILVRRFLQTPTPINWFDLRPILIHASPGHRLLESRTNAAVLDASTPLTNGSTLEAVHYNPYSKHRPTTTDFVPQFFQRFTVLPASQEAPIIPTGSQKSFNRYAQIIPIGRVAPLKIKRAQPKIISSSGLNRLVPLIDTRNIDSIEMDFDKDFQKMLNSQFQSDKSPTSKRFFTGSNHNSVSGTEDEPFTNELESFFASF